MRIINRQYYKLSSKNGLGFTLIDEYETAEEALKGIIKHNRQSIEDGYKPEELTVYLHTFTRVFDDNDNVVSESHNRVKYTEL